MANLPIIKLILTWYDGQVATLWFNDKLIYETREIVLDTNLLRTEIEVPILEAIKLASIIIQGLTVEHLEQLLAAIKAEATRLKMLQLPLLDNPDECSGDCENCDIYQPETYAEEPEEDDDDWIDPSDV